jgi:hypothetical protein
MSKIFKSTITIGSLLLFIVLWNGLYSHYQYLLDPDAVGYLTIAKRVANNDWFNSINGLWSPLNCWLLVPFIKAGKYAFSSALFLNACFGGVAMVLIFQLLFKYCKQNILAIVLAVCLPIVLVYYSYMQVFGDLLQLIFLLIYLLIITSENFWGTWWKYVLCALVMAIGYYAKAYTLPFFILHFTVIHIWHGYQTKKNNFVMMVIAFSITIACIIPWGLQLQKKYGAFSLMGNAGKLNMSWYLLSKKEFKSDIKLLIPPTYKDSPSFWEDPFPSQGVLHSPFESVGLFVRWIARIVHTSINAIVCLNEISALAIVLLLAGIYFLLIKKKEDSLALITWAGCLVPLGFLTMHIETRYIWLVMPVVVCIAAYFSNFIKEKKYQVILSIALGISLIAYPLFHLEQLSNQGKTNFEDAALLKQNGIVNKKVCAVNTNTYNAWINSYLANNYCYTIEQSSFSDSLLAGELKRYGVEYVFVGKNALSADYGLPGVILKQVVVLSDGVVLECGY